MQPANVCVYLRVRLQAYGFETVKLNSLRRKLVSFSPYDEVFYGLFLALEFIFELFFVKKYLLVGAWGMLWAGG